MGEDRRGNLQQALTLRRPLLRIVVALASALRVRQRARGLRGAGGRGRDRQQVGTRSRLRNMNGALRIPLSARRAIGAPRDRQRAVPDDSSICSAAVHAGALHDGGGSDVTIEIRPSEAQYASQDAAPSTRARTTTRGAAASSCCEDTAARTMTSRRFSMRYFFIAFWPRCSSCAAPPASTRTRRHQRFAGFAGDRCRRQGRHRGQFQ